MTINMPLINKLLVDNIPGALPPIYTPTEATMDPKQPYLTCTQHPTKMKAHREVVGVKHAGEKVYGEATAFRKKHDKY
jgi:hypothetical protein